MMIFVSRKEYLAILERIEALEDVVTAPSKPKLNVHRNGRQGGGIFMHEAIRKVMSDGKARNAKQLSKEINKLAITKTKATPRLTSVRLAELSRRGVLARVTTGIYINQ